MSSVLGLDGKMYRNTGSYGSPTWNEMPGVKDLTTSLEKASADVSNRASGWRKERGTLKTLSLSFQMVWDPEDLDFDALLTSFLNNTSIDCVVLDGPVATAGSQGPRATFEVFKFERSEELEGAMMVDVELKPTYATGQEPYWYEAA